MGKTASQRQAEYRARHLKDEEGNGERLDMVISVPSKRALERLAFFYGMKQRSMLELLLQKAENDAITIAASLPAGEAHYYDMRLRMNTVTA